jgi:DNA-binding CsgD family transcriptional regulator
MRVLAEELERNARTRTGPLLDALDQLAAATDAPQLERSILGATMASASADTMSVTTLGPEPGSTRSFPDAFFSASEQSLFHELHQRSPWALADHTQGGEEQPLRISDVLSQRQYRALPIYLDLFHHLEIEHQVAFSVPIDAATQICVVVNRSGRDFSTPEIESLAALRRVLSAAVTPFASPAASRTADLTPREEAVLALVAAGLSNRAVGPRLGVSQRTVDKHLEHIFAKLEVTNRTHAASEWHQRRPPLRPSRS